MQWDYYIVVWGEPAEEFKCDSEAEALGRIAELYLAGIETAVLHEPGGDVPKLFVLSDVTKRVLRNATVRGTPPLGEIIAHHWWLQKLHELGFVTRHEQSVGRAHLTETGWRLAANLGAPAVVASEAASGKGN